MAASAMLVCGLGPLAWSMLWRLSQGADVLGALVHPWGAAVHWLAAPPGAPDPALAGTGLGAIALTGLMLALVWMPPSPAPYGDARFARRPELRAMGLLNRSGVIVGRTRGVPARYLRHGGDHHVLLTAPTRSGKGVGVVVPNLLSWPGSVVVLDVKNENFEATSGFRARCGQAIYRFAPGDPALATHRYNPLDAVRRDPAHRIADLQALSHLLTPEGMGEQRMWNQEARALFVGLSLYILDTPGLALTFAQILRILEANTDLGEAAQALIKARGDTLDPACINLLASFSHKAFKERSGVKSTLTGALELFADPAIDAATAASDFSFEELRRRPMTVYVSVSLDQLDRLAFLLNVVFQQLVGVVGRTAPGDAEPWPVLLLIDEFAALGRLDTIVDRMPFLAGFNVRLLLVVQGLAQLDRLYGHAGREVILQNAGLQLFFAPNDEATATYVSGRLGTRTEVVVSRSRSGTAFSTRAGHMTRTRSPAPQPLMSADEVRRMGADEALVFVEGARPVRAAKIRYYADVRFTARLLPPVSVGTIEVPTHGSFSFDQPVGTGPAEPPPARPTAPRRRKSAGPATQLDFDQLIGPRGVGRTDRDNLGRSEPTS